MSDRVKILTIGYILSWVVGVLALVVGVSHIFSNMMVSMLYFLLSLLFLPPINKLIEKDLKVKISAGLKFILGLVILGFIGAMPRSEVGGLNKQGDTEAEKHEPQKEYHQILIFKGEGIKKSESFEVKGDKFKISYDCTGDLCQAFLHKVGESFGLDVIMNTMHSTHDETIIYNGSGTYYIQANILGKYSMVVYDYS